LDRATHLADVILICNQSEISYAAHSLILELRSPELASRLWSARLSHIHSAECYLSKCKHIVKLDHPFPISAQNFADFVCFLYQGFLKDFSGSKQDRSTVFQLIDYYGLIPHDATELTLLDKELSSGGCHD
jgi:hypothetical protein